MKNKIFYEELKTSIGTLIELISGRAAQAKITNPKYTDELSPYLKIISANVMDAFTLDGNVIKCRFNFEPLLAAVNLVQQKKYPDIFVRAVHDIYQTILTDIQTPSTNNLTGTKVSELEGGHFFYQGIEGDKCAEILNTLYQNDKNVPAGETLWRVLIGLNPSHANEFVKKHAELIAKIRQLPSFQSYPLFKVISHEFILDNPWLLAFFAVDQLADFISLPLSEKGKKHDTIQKLMTINSSNEHSSSIEKPFFLITQNLTPDQYLLKKSLIRFVISHPNYSCKVISESVSKDKFVWSCGVIEEFLAFTSPTVIVDLYLQMDEVISKLMKLAAEDQQAKTANDLRACPEYTWLNERIIQDLEKGDAAYFAKVITIPYILYHLVGLPEFFKISTQKLASFFTHINSKFILQTLGLLDVFDKCKSHSNLEINSEYYPVNKTFANQIYVSVATLFLSDDFIYLRTTWLQNEADRKILIQFPFLLKGLKLNEIKNFIRDNIAEITKNAKNCIENAINPYLNCPLLLAYLDTSEIIRLYNQHANVRALFESKSLPMEIVIEYIKRGIIEELIQAIPSLNNYLQPDHLKQVNPSLLDEPLLTAMTNTETTRQLLKNYPSILDRFNKPVITACAQLQEAIFLRQVLRQNVLIHLLLDNLDHLISDETFDLMKSMVKSLYKNPETQAIVSRIEQKLEMTRKALHERYDLKTESKLIQLAERKLVFNISPYSSTEIFSEQSNSDEIEKILKEDSSLNNVDPIIYVLKNMIDTNPSWTRRLIQSEGFYSALRQYCLSILSICVEKLKSNDNHYPAIYQCVYQYAVLKMEENAYEEAANSFVKYLNYLGLNGVGKDNAFHCLFVCANKLSESHPTHANALYYYRYLAIILLATSPIQSIRVTLPRERLESSLSRKIIDAKRYWHEMALELASKSYDLIQKDTPEIERLALMLSIYELLTQAIRDNFSSDDMTKRAMSLKNQFITAALKQFKTSFAELYTKINQSTQTTNPKTEELPGKKKEPTHYPHHPLDDDKFLNDLSDLYTKIPKLVANGTITLNEDQITSDILTQLQLDIEAYNAMHQRGMPNIKTLIERRVALHKEIETRGTFALIKKRLENDIENTDRNTFEFHKTMTTFSPHTWMRELNELEHLNIMLGITKPDPSKKAQSILTLGGHEEEYSEVPTSSQKPDYLDAEEIDRKYLEKKLRKERKDMKSKEAEEASKRKPEEEEEEASKKLAYQLLMAQEEEAARRREQEEKDSIKEALKIAKEKEQQHQKFFDQLDRQKQAEEKEKKRRHTRNMSAGTLTTFVLKPASSSIETDNKNIMGPGAPIKQAPVMAPQILSETIPVSEIPEEEDKETLIMKIILKKRSIAQKQAELQRKNPVPFFTTPSSTPQPPEITAQPKSGIVVPVKGSKVNRP